VQEVDNINTSAGIPYPFNETIDTAAYVGFEKLADNGKTLPDYIKVGLSIMQVSVLCSLSCLRAYFYFKIIILLVTLLLLY